MLEPTDNSTANTNGEIYTDDELAESVDFSLKLMDMDNDGFISYWEYREGAKKLNNSQ